MYLVNMFFEYLWVCQLSAIFVLFNFRKKGFKKKFKEKQTRKLVQATEQRPSATGGVSAGNKPSLGCLIKNCLFVPFFPPMKTILFLPAAQWWGGLGKTQGVESHHNWKDKKMYF